MEDVNLRVDKSSAELSRAICLLNFQRLLSGFDPEITSHRAACVLLLENSVMEDRSRTGSPRECVENK